MQKKKLILFDVDGTLTVPRQVISSEMKSKLQELQKHHKVGCIGGSNLPKVMEQLTPEVFYSLDYGFCENGLVGYKGGTPFHQQDIAEHLGNTFLNKFINYCLQYISKLDLPIKRGTFIEYRKGMINVSPIGRNCSQEERDEYEQYDLQHNIRGAFVEELQQLFGDKLCFSIGGQISFDCVPHGWTKVYCLQFVQQEFDQIFFFGDKTYKGGNDYEIYQDSRLAGRFAVTSYHQTIDILNKEFIPQ